MLWKRVIVGNQERVLIAKNGRFSGILEPGQHRIFVAPGVSLETERHNLHELVFGSKWADYLVKERPDLVNRFFTRVETSDVQVAMVYVDGKLTEVLLPAKRVLYWRGLAEVTAEVIDVIVQAEIPVSKVPALERLGRNSHATFSVIEEAKTGLLFIDNRLVRVLPPGKYGFWAVTGSPRVEVIDLRQTTVGNFENRLYCLLQLTLHQALGKKTLEEILADKAEINEDLETLEKLVEKVDHLEVTGGFEGLLDNLIELKAPLAGKPR